MRFGCTVIASELQINNYMSNAYLKFDQCILYIAGGSITKFKTSKINCHSCIGMYYTYEQPFLGQWVWSWVKGSLNMTENRSHSEISHLQEKPTVNTIRCLIFTEIWRQNTPLLRWQYVYNVNSFLFHYFSKYESFTFKSFWTYMR
jgi:hypothetical protein